MGIRVVILIFTSFILGHYAWAEFFNFDGKTFTNFGEEFTLQSTDGTTHTVTKQEKIRLLPESELSSGITPQPNMIYFKLKSSGGGKVYSLPKTEFESQILQGRYTKYVRNQFISQRSQKLQDALSGSAGKNLDIANGNFKLNLEKGGSIVLSKGQRIQILSQRDRQEKTGQNPQKIYFYPIDGSTGKADSSLVLSMDIFEFEEELKQNQFTKWFRDQIEAKTPLNHLNPLKQSQASESKKITPVVSVKPKPKPSPTPGKSEVKMEALREYTYLGDEELNITLRYPEGKYKLKSGEKFFLENERGQLYLVKPPLTGRYKIDDYPKLADSFKQGSIEVGEYIKPESPLLDLAPSPSTVSPPQVATPARPKEQTELPTNEQNYQSEPTLQGSVETTIATEETLNQTVNSPHLECDGFEEKLNSLYETCDSEDDYVQDTLEKILMPEDVNSNDAGKFCILAGLRRGFTFNVAKCENGAKVSDKTQVCRSKEYVSFIHKELTQMSNCFTNVKYQEMLPLINAESQFNFNAYNNNHWGEFKGQLNASGLLQMTQPLVESQKKGFMIDTKGRDRELYTMDFNKNSKYCNSIIQEVRDTPLTRARDVCKRTEIPTGFRKNFFLTMANYSYYKQSVKSEIENTENAYFKGKELFSEEQKEQLLIDLTRLMHNRGIGVFKKRIRSFFYDLFHGRYGQDQKQLIVTGKMRKVVKKKNGDPLLDPETEEYVTKIEPTRSYVKHGNARIYELWGRPGFKAPLDHESFVNYFSSYIFWEGKSSKRSSGSRGKFYSPNEESHDSEGGTYLHKLACDQKRLSKKAKEYSGNQNIECGYPIISPEQMEHTQVEVGWYINECRVKNKSRFSQRQCTAKDPYKIRDDQGKRRLTDSRIGSFMENDRLLKLCDSESLRGLASRPLLEFYVENPEDYK